MTGGTVNEGMSADLAADLAAAAHTLAGRFAAGGTLWAIAPSAEPHAQHIAVEFVHPVIVGKRALPAVALTGPNLVDELRMAVRPGDMVIAVAAAENPVARSAMRHSPALGASTVWIGSGPRPAPDAGAEHLLWLDDGAPTVPAAGGFVLLYHLLWELTQVCIEHPGSLTPPQREPAIAQSCLTHSDEPTNFLYPFLDEQHDDPAALLADLAASAQAKAAESLALGRSTLESNAELLAAAATELSRRFAAGGRLFTFGNGGSCTDATTLAGLFARPVAGTPLPAWSLTEDPAILTALGNDVGYPLVFARQLIARGQPGDIAIAMSTSGGSPNLLAALAEADRREMYTIGVAGYHGGEFAHNPNVDVCLGVASPSVHRIQEAQALLGYELWLAVQQRATQ